MRSSSLIVGLSAGAVGLALTLSSTAVAAPYTLWQHPYADGDSNVMVLMHMNETSGTTAANTGDKVTWGTSDGTYSAAATGNVASGAGIPGGDFGNAFSTQGGTAWIDVPDAASMDGAFGDGRVIEMWFKANSTGDSVFASQYTGTLGGPPSGRHWIFEIYQDKLYFGSFRSDGVSMAMTGTTAINAGQWYHVAAQYNTNSAINGGSNRWELYLNGTMEASASYGSWGYANDSVPIVIGAYNDHTSNFDGYIDDFRISSGQYEFAVPEPASLSLLALGGLTMLRRRK